MSLDSDVIVDRRRIRRKLTFWRVAAAVIAIAAIAGVGMLVSPGTRGSLAAIATVFGIFLIRQFAQGIPDELLDAARLDGASELRIYWTVVLPLMRPILVTLGVFTFLSSWNDFLWPLTVLTDETKYTLPVALANLAGEHVQDTELMMAGAVITVLPGLLVFLALQRSYVEGIVMGSLKE